MTKLSNKLIVLAGSLLILLCGCNSHFAYKNYTNEDFYKNGVFQPEVAKEAVKQLILKSEMEYTNSIDSELWVSDFGLGDYEHVGLASVTWVNDPEYGYFAMTMYLLPGQMIPEHVHKPIAEAPARAAKHESWRVIKGKVYNFSEVGDTFSDLPHIPKSFGKIRSKNYILMGQDKTTRLKQPETYHFMMAGDDGAIVDEYGINHDRRGWFSSNPAAHPTK